MLIQIRCSFRNTRGVSSWLETRTTEPPEPTERKSPPVGRKMTPVRTQPQLATSRQTRAFSLVELMIVVAIIGVLASLAIYGVRKYLTSAKTAEARTALGRMAKDAQSVFESETLLQNVLNVSTSSTVTRSLCDDAPPVPAVIASVQNGKYQSSPADWKAGGWPCLKFTMNDPQYFMYSYASSATTALGNETFTAQANGDLDADGAESTFQFFGKVQKVGSDLVVTLADQIREIEPEE